MKILGLKNNVPNNNNVSEESEYTNDRNRFYWVPGMISPGEKNLVITDQ